LAKIAVELEKALAQRAIHGSAGGASGRLLAGGDGWSVEDVICTSGPQDRSFEEFHAGVSIAIVAAGTFQYRSSHGRELMTPGSLLLGNPGQCFECGHEHGTGDRCIAFRYGSEYFERIAADAGRRSAKRIFRVPRLASRRELSPVIARAFAGVTGAAKVAWEELSLLLAGQAIQLMDGIAAEPAEPTASAIARVTRIVRMIEQKPDGELTVAKLAAESGLSPYHFLRTFERLTGATPHQYILRARLREAAIRLTTEPSRILDIAFDSGFGDVSNFNRTFRAEFGMNPRAYRAKS
jgi:AraC family transcriptional regulator